MAPTDERDAASKPVTNGMSSDEELVARSMGGDLDSFNQLVLRWERPIYALAYRVIGREEYARDVAQETFLRAFRYLKARLLTRIRRVRRYSPEGAFCSVGQTPTFYFE